MHTNIIHRLLRTFDYDDVTSFWLSVAPSVKYRVTKPLLLLSFISPAISVVVSVIFPAIEATLGIAGGAFIALMLAFITELITGVWASHIRGEQFSSLKLSRFSLKVFYYLVIIFVPYQFQLNFKEHGNWLVSDCFGWLHIFLVSHIVFENLVSILENGAVIDGKDKTAWINAVKDKLTSFIK